MHGLRRARATATSSELFALLNPVRHARLRGRRAYKVEPYVVAADVYVPPHTGRGGWTWYTGSAGWLYRAGLEDILGFRVRGDRCASIPAYPANGRGSRSSTGYRSARYEIAVENPRGANRGVSLAELDGEALPVAPLRIPLVDDGLTHRVRVILG